MVANEVLEHYALRVTFNYVLPLLTVSISWKKKPTFLPICTAAILYFYFFFPSKKCYRKRLYGLQVHEMDYGNMTPSIQIQLKEEMIKKKIRTSQIGDGEWFQQYKGNPIFSQQI